MTTSVLLKSESFHILHIPLLEYNHRILSTTVQSKSILKGLTETWKTKVEKNPAKDTQRLSGYRKTYWQVRSKLFWGRDEAKIYGIQFKSCRGEPSHITGLSRRHSTGTPLAIGLVKAGRMRTRYLNKFHKKGRKGSSGFQNMKQKNRVNNIKKWTKIQGTKMAWRKHFCTYQDIINFENLWTSKWIKAFTFALL